MYRRLGAVLFAAAITVLAAGGHAIAASWVLALPPLKPPASGSDNDAREAVMASLDRTAPVDAWQQGTAYASGQACEDARLEALKQFDDAVGSLGGEQVRRDQLPRLTDLGRRAFGRCVPSLAFRAAR